MLLAAVMRRRARFSLTRPHGISSILFYFLIIFFYATRNLRRKFSEKVGFFVRATNFIAASASTCTISVHFISRNKSALWNAHIGMRFVSCPLYFVNHTQKKDKDYRYIEAFLCASGVRVAILLWRLNVTSKPR